MTPRFRYPRFEENQVLSYQHLNQLTEFLEGEDRLSRRALIGAGAAYGLALEHSTGQGLRLRRGAALTTDGFLCHIETDHTFVVARTYRDPVGYPPFHGGGGADAAQTDLWELLEERPEEGDSVTALTGGGAARFLADKAALLFLEVTTADLDTCIDNHCINQGKERRGVWRVLLAQRAALTDIRQQALGNVVPWPAWSLDELRAERLCLQATDVLSHAALSTRGLDFVRQSRTRLLPAIQEAVPLFGALLDVPAQTTADALNALSARFDSWLAGMVSGDRVGWQHGFDHIRHLYRAWIEFVEAAFHFVTEPAPLREPFPQHVLLGIVPTARYGEPDSLRHYFVPSPVLTLGGRDLELCRHRFMRLLTMCSSFGVPASRGVRVTPGAALDHWLDEQAVPFYYDPATVLGWWNAEATWRNRGRLLPCYHREALANDPAVRDPLRFPSDSWEFYRIEGHHGRNCREVEQALEETRRHYHLAFDVVAVTFGPDEPETTNCLCELDDIKVIYRVSADEMRCHIARLLGFLGALAKPAIADTSVFDRIVLPEGQVNIAFDLRKVDFIALGISGVRGQPGAPPKAAAPKAAAPAPKAAAPRATAISGATAAANAAVAAQTEDIRTVYLDNLHISYPIISVALYPFLTPEALVNSLARELMGRLTEADGRLEAGVEAFNADQFSQTIDAGHAKASDLADALTGLSTDVEPDVLKQRELLRQELLLFLANCVPTRIIQIAILFAAALERLRATPTLAAFLRKHPGLEHLGGVPKGGTFVLVCGRPEARPPILTAPGISVARPPSAIDVLRATRRAAAPAPAGSSSARPASSFTRSALTGSLSDNLLLKTYGYYQASQSINVLVDNLATGSNLTAADKLLLNETYTPTPTQPGPATIDLEAIYERLRDFFGVETGAEQDIVLADFCVPYLCCSECTCTTTVVLPAPPPNTPPTVSPIEDITIEANTPIEPINFTVGDAETPVENLVVTVTSSNQALVPDANIVMGGTGADRTLTITPVADQGGTATITVTVSDGSLTATTAFDIIVRRPNTPPTISEIPSTTIEINTSTRPLRFTVGDAETPVENLVVTAASSNPSLVPASNIVFGGSGANRTVTITPTPGRVGTATITVTVSDGSLTASTSFVLTVARANTPPIISRIPDRTIEANTTAGPLSFDINDAETPAENLVVTVASSNQTLVPDGNIIVSGSGAGRALTITPAANQSGTATITVTVSDGSLTASTSFVLTVTRANTPPTISRILDTTIEANTTAALRFTVGDAETPPANLLVTVTSSNQTLVPNGNIVLSGVGADRSLTIRPAPNQAGSTTLTVTVSDGSLTTSTTFVLTVTRGNTPPIISEIQDTVIEANTTAGPLRFTIEDAETPPENLSLSASSSNPALVPDANIIIGGSGANRTITITPAANQSGTATITVTVSDGTLTASTSFDLNVRPRQDLPPITFDPGRLDVVLSDGLVREVIGSRDPNLIGQVTALNSRAAEALSDPAVRESLNTPDAEKQIGAEARQAFQRTARFLLDESGTFPDEIPERLWDFGQVPIGATLCLAGLRTKDVTSGGEIAQAFFLLKEILDQFRRTPHGASMKFNDEVIGLLEATAADNSKPVLQALSNDTAAAFPGVRARRPPPKKPARHKPAKAKPKRPAHRPPKRSRRRR